EDGLAKYLVGRQLRVRDLRHQARFEPHTGLEVENGSYYLRLPGLLYFLHDPCYLFDHGVIETGAHLAAIMKHVVDLFSNVQRSEGSSPSPFPFGVSDDKHFSGLPDLYLVPTIASASREILTVTAFCHDAFQPGLARGLKQCLAILHEFADPVRGVTAKGIAQPLLAFCQRFIDERASVKVKTIKDVTVYRFGL